MTRSSLPPLVVFDLDGTLVDTAPDLLRALNVVLTEAGLPVAERGRLATNFGHGARALIVEGLRQAGTTVAPPAIEAMVQRFLAVYAADVAAASLPYPGAVAALDRLAARGSLLAVCTNKRGDLADKLLAALGLDRRFAAVVGGDALKVRKPDPGHLLETIARAGGDPALSVMIGDSDADVGAARAAGVPVIGVTFGYSPEPVASFKPDALIDHFDELDDALGGLLPAFAGGR